MRKLIFILRSVLSVSIGDCGYDTLRSNNEQIKASWDEVANQYRRQADIAPVLLNSVKNRNQLADYIIRCRNAIETAGK